MKIRAWEKKVKNAKVQCTLEHLCQGLPPCFLDFMMYVRRLGFEENPDYAYLKNIFASLLRDMAVEYEDHANLEYEWTIVRRRIEEQNKKDEEEAERIRQIKL
jgi:casein kinase 1